jgi:UDP-3-O-[3-hydroxymyristoyl] glucosamine N-acyltransferase
MLAQSGTIANVPPGATMFGTLARPHREYLRGQAALNRLAKIVGELEDLVKATPNVSSPDQ